MLIRRATVNDIEAINAIYNDEILHGIATFDSVVRNYDGALQWFNSHNDTFRPIFVAVDAHDKAIAYCSLSVFNPKDAYIGTTEISLYVDKAHQGQGIGQALLSFILDYAQKRNDILNIVAIITSSNERSKALFRKLGFAEGGEIKNVGVKFGKILSITNLYKIIHD